MFAELLVWMGVANNTHVGMYALLGAAGFLGGLMRMSAAQVRHSQWRSFQHPLTAHWQHDYLGNSLVQLVRCLLRLLIHPPAV
jgi:hypothetical protein